MKFEFKNYHVLQIVYKCKPRGERLNQHWYENNENLFRHIVNSNIMTGDIKGYNFSYPWYNEVIKLSKANPTYVWMIMYYIFLC